MQYRRKPRQCPLCGEWRPLTAHHLSPRAMGVAIVTDDVVHICRPCHDAIHRLYTNEELNTRLSERDALLTDKRLLSEVGGATGI